MASETEKPSLGIDDFERLLRALGGDREESGRRYETLRRKLVAYFSWRDAPDPETLADRTFDRVVRKLAEGETIRAAEPARYVYAVARNILKESWSGERRQRAAHREMAHSDPGAVADEKVHACLERCLGGLPERSRSLLLRYYSAQGAARIAERKSAAAELGVPLNALRIRMHRLRASLERCIGGCLDDENGETNRAKTHVRNGRRERP